MNALMERTLGDLVAERPSRSRVFEKHGIDYCCGGRRTLALAAAQAGADLEGLATALESIPATASERDWRDATIRELVEHILVEHHDWLKENLPRIGELAGTVARVHGDRDPFMLALREVVAALRLDMEPHLEKEERILFPAALALESTGVPSLGCHAVQSLEGPVSVMEREHVAVGGLLDRIVELTDGFRPPEGACGTWRALYDALGELDRNTRSHVHLENEVLHAKIRSLEAMPA